MNGPDWDVNPGLVHHCFSHPFTIATYWNNRLNPVREDPGGDLWGQKSFKGGTGQTGWISPPDSSVGTAPD